MITAEQWNDVFDSIRDDFSGDIKLAWYEITDETIENLEGKIIRNKLMDLIPLKNSKFSERRIVDSLKSRRFSYDEIEIILKYSLRTEGNFPQLQGMYGDKEIIITPAKTEVSFNILIDSDFKIILTAEGKLSSFKKKFDGFQDIVIGVEDFDSQFIIKGDPEDKVIKFLSYNKVRNLIRSFEPVKAFTLDNTGLTFIKNITRSETISEEKLGNLISNLSLLAEAILNYEDLKDEKPLQGEKKKGELIKDLTVEERLNNLERLVEEINLRLKRLEGR